MVTSKVGRDLASRPLFPSSTDYRYVGEYFVQQNSLRVHIALIFVPLDEPDHLLYALPKARYKNHIEATMASVLLERREIVARCP